jgi:hypothetical protein
MTTLRRPGIGPFLAVTAASVLAAAFVAWALAGAAGTSCSVSSAGGETCVDEPLVHGFGAGALAAAAPLAISLLVWWLLHRSCSGGGRAPRGVAAALASMLVVVSVLGAASIGIFLLPVAVLLVVAVATTVPAAR